MRSITSLASTLAPLVAAAVGLASIRAQAQEGSCEERRARVQSLLREGEHEEAATLSIGLVDESCADRDAILYDLALAFRGSHRIGSAFRAREMLLNELPRSPLVGPTLFSQAADYRAVGMYEEAAQHYLQFAERFPAEVGTSCSSETRAAGTCPDARLALETGAFLQLALGQREAARRSAADFARRYARTDPERVAAIVFAMGRSLDDPDAIVADAEAFSRTYGGIRTLDQPARTPVPLARAQSARGRARAARAALMRVVALVTPEALAQITAADPPAGQLQAREAVAEALFLLAELDASGSRDVAAPPPLTGPHTEAAIRAWARGPLTVWRDRELSRLVPLEAAYARVLAQDIPAWRIAALEGSARLFLRILEASWRMAPPPWVEADLSQLAVFELARAEILEPVTIRARASCEDCVRLARSARLFGEASVRCMRGLDSLVDPEPALSEELHAEPIHEGEDFAQPAPIRASPRTGSR